MRYFECSPCTRAATCRCSNRGPAFGMAVSAGSFDLAIAFQITSAALPAARVDRDFKKLSNYVVSPRHVVKNVLHSSVPSMSIFCCRTVYIDNTRSRHAPGCREELQGPPAGSERWQTEVPSCAEMLYDL